MLHVRVRPYLYEFISFSWIDRRRCAWSYKTTIASACSRGCKTASYAARLYAFICSCSDRSSKNLCHCCESEVSLLAIYSGHRHRYRWLCWAKQSAQVALFQCFISIHVSSSTNRSERSRSTSKWLPCSHSVIAGAYSGWFTACLAGRLLDC